MGIDLRLFTHWAGTYTTWIMRSPWSKNKNTIHKTPNNLQQEQNTTKNVIAINKDKIQQNP